MTNYVLRLNSDELLHKFFVAQEKFPGKNDWILTVKENLKHLNINLTLNEIKRKTVVQFKKIVKEKIKQAALKYLINISISKEHSKMNNLKYDKLSMQEYFCSTNFNKIESQSLFKYRTRMSNFAANFPNGRSTVICPICEDESTTDSESHSFICEKMITLLPEISNNSSMDIYSKDIKTMKSGMEALTRILNLRSELFD